MPQFDGLIGLLDSRSFGTVWYWLIVIGIWSFNGRTVAGVPTEILSHARRALSKGKADGEEVLSLLDWLSLALPRWRLGHREGVVYLGVTAFAMTMLASLGFGYNLEMAQALTLILIPLLFVFWMRARLARKLEPILISGQSGDMPIPEIAAKVIRAMIWHRRIIMLVSVIAVAVTAFWASIWGLLHPNGL